MTTNEIGFTILGFFIAILSYLIIMIVKINIFNNQLEKETLKSKPAFLTDPDVAKSAIINNIAETYNGFGMRETIATKEYWDNFEKAKKENEAHFDKLKSVCDHRRKVLDLNSKINNLQSKNYRL